MKANSAKTKSSQRNNLKIGNRIGGSQDPASDWNALASNVDLDRMSNRFSTRGGVDKLFESRRLAKVDSMTLEHEVVVDTQLKPIYEVHEPNSVSSRYSKVQA